MNMVLKILWILLPQAFMLISKYLICVSQMYQIVYLKEQVLDPHSPLNLKNMYI